MNDWLVELIFYGLLRLIIRWVDKTAYECGDECCDHAERIKQQAKDLNEKGGGWRWLLRRGMRDWMDEITTEREKVADSELR